MKPHIFLIALLLIIVTIGLILPDGIRAAAANNAWSIAFLRGSASSNTPPQLTSPPASHRHAQVLLARSALARDDLEGAFSFISPLVDSPDRMALAMVANTLYQLGEYENAVDIWKALNNEGKLYSASRDLTGKELHDSAHYTLERLYEMNPEKFAANYAGSLGKQNDLLSAIAILQDSIISYPQSSFRVYWFLYLGDIYRSQQKFTQAEEAYQLGLLEFPEDARTWRNFNLMCQAHRNNLAAGVTCYEKLIGMNPSDPDLYTSAGETFEAFGLFDQAYSAYQSALMLDPQHQAAAQGLERLSGSD